MKDNVIVITIDALRQDRIGIYGNKNNLTPNIDRLAKKSWIFDNAFTVSNTSAPSHTSLLSGCYPTTHGVRQNGWKIGPHVILLSDILRKRGYATVGAVSQEMLSSAYNFNKGFEVFYDNSKIDHFMSYISKIGTNRYNLRKLLQKFHIMDRHSRDGRETIKDVIGWLERNDRAPFFLFMHIFDVHRDTFSKMRGGHQLSLQERYDANVKLADELLGKVFNTIEHKGLMQETMIILMADHGESLGESGHKMHGWSLLDIEFKIPLIMFIPQKRDHRIRSLCRSIDVVPTILDVLSLSTTVKTDGKSLVPLVKRDRPLDEEIYLEGCLTFLDIRGIRTREWKYILKEGKEEVLYDLTTDPKETTNVVHKNPAIAKKLHDKVLSHFSNKHHTQETDEHTKEMLRKLGYLE